MLFAQIQASTGGEGTLVISAILAGFCLLTVLCTLALKETHRETLT